MKDFILKNEILLSKIATIAIFMALIRCIGECFRLQSLASHTLSFEDIKPFLIGALVAAIASFINTILIFYAKPKSILVVFVLTILGLLFIKSHYALK
jgi:hypothetical protein